MITIVETPEDMQQLMRDCIQATYRWIDTCNGLFKLSMPHYRIIFDLKSGTAGKARLGNGIISYNPTLLRENPLVFVRQTTGHEVAHFANYNLSGPSVDAHGDEWKRVMRYLNLPAVRCHSYNTAHVPTKVFRQRRSIPRTNISNIGVGKITEFD